MNKHIAEWLKETSTFYDWVGDEMRGIIKKWETEKDKIIENYENKKKKQKS